MTEPVAEVTAEMVPLPPGRHGLAPELVRHSQRRRLMTACAELIATDGYRGLTVTAVAARARVSTRAFYQLFDGLSGCLVAAFEADAETVLTEVRAAAAGAKPEESLRAAVRAGLEVLAAEPSIAHLLCVEPPVGATGARAARRRLIATLATMLHDGSPTPVSLPGEERLVGGALTLIVAQTRAGQAHSLGDLAPQLTKLLRPGTALSV